MIIKGGFAMSETRLIEKYKEEKDPKYIIDTVFNALKEKGYNPISQFTGYLLSGDPTYITSHNNSRVLISSLERDEILEVLIKHYLGEE